MINSRGKFIYIHIPFSPLRPYFLFQMLLTGALLSAIRTQPWTIEETTRVLSLLKQHRLLFCQDHRPSSILWTMVAENVPGRSSLSCYRRFRTLQRHPEMQHFLTTIQSSDTALLKDLNSDAMARIAGKASLPMLSTVHWSSMEDARL